MASSLLRYCGNTRCCVVTLYSFSLATCVANGHVSDLTNGKIGCREVEDEEEEGALLT